VDAKNIKCPLQWWEKHENMFPTIGFYDKQFLKIVGSQIEIEINFLLIQILIILRRYFFNQKIWTN
jgi:hypothetical protein